MIFPIIASWIVVRSGQKQILVHGIPITDLLAVCTFLLLLFTFYLTLKGVKEAARGNILNALPVISVLYKYDQSQIVLKNIGKGDAVNIKLDTYYQGVIDSQVGLFGVAVLKFDTLDHLPAGEERNLDTSKSRNVGMMGPYLMKFMAMKSQKPLYFHVRYEDLSGQKYIARIKIQEYRVRLQKPPRKYNFLRKVRYGLFRAKEQAFNVKGRFKVIYYKRKYSKSQKSK